MKINRIRSRFNKNEEFSYDNVPKHFESISDTSIRKLKAYCLHLISRRYKGKFEPQALKAMLSTINGEFDTAYAELEGDYSTRRENLRKAYIEGIADLGEQLVEYKNEVAQHENLFEEYAECLKRVTGHDLKTNLRITDQEVAKIEQKYEELRKEYR